MYISPEDIGSVAFIAAQRVLKCIPSQILVYMLEIGCYGKSWQPLRRFDAAEATGDNKDLIDFDGPAAIAHGEMAYTCHVCARSL